MIWTTLESGLCFIQMLLSPFALGGRRLLLISLPTDSRLQRSCHGADPISRWSKCLIYRPAGFQEIQPSSRVLLVLCPSDSHQRSQEPLSAPSWELFLGHGLNEFWINWDSRSLDRAILSLFEVKTDIMNIIPVWMACFNSSPHSLPVRRHKTGFARDAGRPEDGFHRPVDYRFVKASQIANQQLEVLTDRLTDARRSNSRRRFARRDEWARLYRQNTYAPDPRGGWTDAKR